MPQRVLPIRPEPRTSAQFVQHMGTILKLHKDTLRFTQHLFKRFKVKISVGKSSSRTNIGLLLQTQSNFCAEKCQMISSDHKVVRAYLPLNPIQCDRALQGSQISPPWKSHLTLMGCLWIACKLEESREGLPTAQQLVNIVRPSIGSSAITPGAVNVVEVQVMSLLNWQPLQGWDDLNHCKGVRMS